MKTMSGEKRKSGKSGKRGTKRKGGMQGIGGPGGPYGEKAFAKPYNSEGRNPDEAFAKPGAHFYACQLDGLGEAGGRWLGGDELGDVDMSASFIMPSTVAKDAEQFDTKLNAWLLDYAKAAARLPPALVSQVDGFVSRWRSIKNDFYFFETTRITEMVAAMGEWNGLKSAVASYGVTSVVSDATVTVQGQSVAADKIPYSPDFMTQVKTYVKWGAILVGGVMVFKFASDLGVLTKIGTLASGISKARGVSSTKTK